LKTIVQGSDWAHPNPGSVLGSEKKINKKAESLDPRRKASWLKRGKFGKRAAPRRANPGGPASRFNEKEKEKKRNPRTGFAPSLQYCGRAAAGGGYFP